jgi:hypothetical protein
MVVTKISYFYSYEKSELVVGDISTDRRVYLTSAALKKYRKKGRVRG